VARDIVRLHGGELYTKPSIYDEARGTYKTTFTITLPWLGDGGSVENDGEKDFIR